MRIKIVFLHAPIALSSSCQFNFIVSSPPAKYGGGEGAIDFSFLKKKIVAVWDFLHMSGIFHVSVRQGLAENLF